MMTKMATTSCERKHDQFRSHAVWFRAHNLEQRREELFLGVSERAEDVDDYDEEEEDCRGVSLNRRMEVLKSLLVIQAPMGTASVQYWTVIAAEVISSGKTMHHCGIIGQLGI